MYVSDGVGSQRSRQTSTNKHRPNPDSVIVYMITYKLLKEHVLLQMKARMQPPYQSLADFQPEAIQLLLKLIDGSRSYCLKTICRQPPFEVNVVGRQKDMQPKATLMIIQRRN